MFDINLGFNSSDLCFNLIERTYYNDTCRSFYFKHKHDFYILYVDYDDVEQRECDSYKKYMLVVAGNHGDDRNPEAYKMDTRTPLLQTDNVSKLIQHLNQLRES